MIKVEDLTFFYKKSKTPILKNISFSISRGESIAIMGHTGAGKSSLLLTFNGIIPKFIKGKLSGDVLIDGKSTINSKVPELSSKVGIVFQDFEIQLFSTNVELEAAFLPENLGLDRTEMKSRVLKYLDLVGLKENLDRQPAELSGGEKQRLAIASVLTGEPDIICFDEPTTDLDPEGKREIFEIAHTLQREKNTTLVMVEHEVEEVASFDRIFLMKNGEIQRIGSPNEMFKDINELKEMNIKPPQVSEYFYHKGSKEIPVDLGKACEMFHVKQFKFDDKKFSELKLKESDLNYKDREIHISTRNLCFRYSKNSPVVIKDINLDIHRGEYVAILGSNGSGKTTLIKHFNGLLTPTEGDVFVNGTKTRSMKIHELGKIVGYVFQNPDHQIFSERVWDEVAFGPKQLGFSKEEIEINVSDALSAVGLESHKDSDPFSLTKGERQRVAVASALAAKTDVLIFDEPTTGLDYNELKGMLSLIDKLNSDGHTIIIVTHSMWVASENAHRVVVMKDGQILKNGITREVFSDIDTIHKASLQIPQISLFSQSVSGKTVLSVDEMLYCT